MTMFTFKNEATLNISIQLDQNILVKSQNVDLLNNFRRWVI